MGTWPACVSTSLNCCDSHEHGIHSDSVAAVVLPLPAPPFYIEFAFDNDHQYCSWCDFHPHLERERNWTERERETDRESIPKNTSPTWHCYIVLYFYILQISIVKLLWKCNVSVMMSIWPSTDLFQCLSFLRPHAKSLDHALLQAWLKWAVCCSKLSTGAPKGKPRGSTNMLLTQALCPRRKNVSNFDKLWPLINASY